MRTRSQTSDTRRRKASSPPLSPISELSQNGVPIQQDDGAITTSEKENDRHVRHAVPPESHDRQTFFSEDAQTQGGNELDDDSAALPQLSLTPPPARQTVFLPSPQQNQPCSPSVDPQTEAEMKRRFEEERRLGESHSAALGLMTGGSQGMEVDSVLDGEEENVLATEEVPNDQYHSRQQERAATKAETEAAEILLHMRKAVEPVPKPRKKRGPYKKKSSGQNGTSAAQKTAEAKAKASYRKKAVSETIVSSSSSDDQTEPQACKIGARSPQVRFAEQDDIRHFDTEGPTNIASTSSCIDTECLSQSGSTAKDAMIVRPQSPIKINMDRVAVNTSANTGAVIAGPSNIGPPILRPSFDFPVNIPNVTTQVLPRAQEAPRERIARLGDWLMESVTQRPAYISALYRALIAKNDLDTARKLLELVHSVQRRNVANMPSMPRPLNFGPSLENNRRIQTVSPCLGSRPNMETSEAMMPPAKLLTGDAVASDGSRERPVEDLRHLRREVSPDTP